MDGGYQPVYSYDAVEAFNQLSKKRRRILLDTVQILANDPFLTPDLTTEDADHRQISHLLSGDFFFSYYVDHAAKWVMILDLEDTR